MKLAVIVKPNNGCSFYRLILPLESMPLKDTDEVKIFYPEGVDTTGYSVSDCICNIDAFEADIIWFNGIIPRDIKWVQEQKKKGIKIVFDTDDYWELETSHPVHDIWYKNNSNELIKDYIKEADVVFVPNEQLVKRVRPLNKNCVVVPNAVPFNRPSYMQNDHKYSLDHRKMNFLYSGGSTHYNDILILKNKFDKLGADKFIKDKALFTLAGYNPLPNKHCQWDKMASIFKRTNSYQILDTKPIEEHLKFYNQADVVLVPLVKNQFNECKSILKIIEASTRELPCIVSSVLPYTELKDYPGIFWDNWIDNIKYCIKNPIFVQDQGKMLAEKIKEKYDISIWSLTRYQIFTHLIK